MRLISLQGLVSHEIATSYLSAFGLILTHEIAILSKVQKPDNFESHSCLNLNFQNLWSNFAECESFLESNSPDILALYETIPGWLNLFQQFLYVHSYSYIFIYYLRMQLLVGEPTDKNQKQRLRSTTICSISLLAFSDFERAVGLSPPGSWIHRAIIFLMHSKISWCCRWNLAMIP